MKRGSLELVKYSVTSENRTPVGLTIWKFSEVRNVKQQRDEKCMKLIKFIKRQNIDILKSL
jgi:hypothetical protein